MEKNVEVEWHHTLSISINLNLMHNTYKQFINYQFVDMKKKGKVLAVGYAILIFVSSLTASNLHRSMGREALTKENILLGVILDIRNMDEYNAGHIKDAISIPMKDILCETCLRDVLREYEKNEIIIIYGDNKEDEEMAKNILLRNGFKNVYILEGNIADLEKKGYSIVRNDASSNDRYFTGCISLDNYNVEDKRLMLKGDIPPSWDWRHATYEGITGDWTTRVKSQGNCGSCWDFAAMGALESIINIRAHDPNLDMDLSEQYLLSCPPNSGGCSGWNAYWAYAYIYLNGGIIPESCFPYRASDVIPCSDKCNDWREKLLPISGYGSIRNPDREYLKQMIVNFGPVVAEMTVYDDFKRYSYGVYEHPGDEPTSDINHQVVIVGYDDSQQCWICKNSWGITWGEEGWFRIAYGDCQIEHYIVYANFTPLIPKADGPYYGKIGEEIRFDGGKSYSLLYPIVSYSWDFGDGATGSGIRPSHTYSKEGRFVVKLTVTDEKGNEATDRTYAYVDETPPVLQVNRPKENYLYYFNKEKYSIPFRTVIIGNITVSIEADDEISGIDKMELYIDGNLIEEGNESIEWNWKHATFGFHVLEIKAYDMAGNVESKKIKVFTWMD